MNTTSNSKFNKDNAGATVLLTTMFIFILSGVLNTATVVAKEVSVTPATSSAHIEKIVVTATRLK